MVSIPFEQGDVFRQCQLFSTNNIEEVSIPFEQGDVFRPLEDYMSSLKSRLSQSLSSRAMSFD